MKNLKKLLLMGLLSLSLMLTACGGNNNQTADDGAEEAPEQEATTEETTTEEPEEAEETEETEETEEEESSEVGAVELSEWDGEWNSMDAYIDDPEVEAVLQEEADEHGETLEEVKEEQIASRQSDYGGMVVDGNTVTLYEGKVEEGNVVAESEYAYLESQEMDHGGSTMYWHIFENQGEDGPKYLALMDLHGEDTMAHFHMRYMDDLAELDADDEWYPTYIRASSTPAEASEMFGHHHDHDHDHDHGEEGEEEHEH